MAVLAASLPAGGQQEPKTRFADELVITEVLLDVLVTDKRERVIVGLTSDDFVVEEDGESVDLTSVTFYSSRILLEGRDRLERRGAQIEEVPEDRFFIVFFQQQIRASGEIPGLLGRQLEAAQECRNWLETELLPGDRVAVVAYDARLEVLQDFTQDKSALQKAVIGAARGQRGSQDWPSRQPAIGEGPSLLRGLPQGRELAAASRDIYTALQVLAGAAGQVRGRKILLFFGRGFGDIDNFGFWRPDPRYYQPTIEVLNDNNVAVYSLDVTPAGIRHTLEDSLDAIAHDTGGYSYRFFNSFLIPLRQIADTNSGYYLLSYQSRRPPAETGFQRVKVSTVNPDLKVKARQGYLYGN